MLKKLPVLIFLFVYSNSFLLIPQVDETNTYISPGKIKDDINSVYEFFDQVILHNTANDNAGDKDGDSIDMEIVESVEHCPYSGPIVVRSPFLFEIKNAFRLYIENGYPQSSLNVFSPPPDITLG